VSPLESAAASAAGAILSPLVQELTAYILGDKRTLPKWMTTLPATLRSRVALDARTAREEIRIKKAGTP
jgi:hypothetical protein